MTEEEQLEILYPDEQECVEWPEDKEGSRMIPIGQNGNTGEHYEEEE